MRDEQLIALARKYGAEIGFCYDDRSECVGGMSAQQLRSLLQAVADASYERGALAAATAKLHNGDYLKHSDPRETCSEAVRNLKGTLPEMEQGK